MLKEKKSFGRVKGQTKAQSILSDSLLSPYEIQLDEYSYVVVDASKNGNNFCGSFTTLNNAVNKIIQYQIASKREVFDLENYLKEYKNIKSQLEEKLKL